MKFQCRKSADVYLDLPRSSSSTKPSLCWYCSLLSVSRWFITGFLTPTRRSLQLRHLYQSRVRSRDPRALLVRLVALQSFLLILLLRFLLAHSRHLHPSLRCLHVPVCASLPNFKKRHLLGLLCVIPLLLNHYQSPYTWLHHRVHQLSLPMMRMKRICHQRSRSVVLR